MFSSVKKFSNCHNRIDKLKEKSFLFPNKTSFYSSISYCYYHIIVISIVTVFNGDFITVTKHLNKDNDILK